MSGKNGNRYSPEFKFRVVVEALRGEGQRTEAEVARAYGVHPVTLTKWKKQFMERGAEVFGGKEELKAYEKQVADQERMLGHKEVEIALLQNFLGGRSR